MKYMQRRDFIKYFTGNDKKQILFWAGVISLLVVFLNFDLNLGQVDLWKIIKVMSIIVGGFIVLVLLLSLFRFLFISIINSLPTPISGWLKRNGKTIVNVIAGLACAYFLYDAFIKEKYSLIIWVFLYVGISLLFRVEKETEKT